MTPEVERDSWHSGDAPRIAALFFAGLALRLWWIHRFPAIFGGDTVLHLANYQYIILSYQLPLLQAAVHYLHALTPSPTAVRWFMSLIGAAAGVGFYLLALRLVPRTEALYGALLFSLNPFILPLSTVPYQEILMIAGLLFGFYGAFADRPVVASIGLGIACLTRYESWLACPVFLALYLRRRGWSARHVAAGIALFGWAPVAWMIYSGGLTPAGTVAIENHLTIGRFVRWAFVGYVTLLHTPLPVIALALLGLVVLVQRRLWRNERYLALAAYLGLFLVALLFSAHGTQPDPERRVTDREAHIPLMVFSLAAALGLTAVRKYRAAVVALCVAVSVGMVERFFVAQTRTPEVAISYSAARYLDSVVTPEQHVAILAKPIDGVAAYVGKVTAIGGRESRAAAIAVLNKLETTPPDYQRILVQSRLGKAQLDSYASLIAHEGSRDEVLVRPRHLVSLPQWIARWSDFRPTSDEEVKLAAVVESRTPVWVRAVEGHALMIFRLDSAAGSAALGEHRLDQRF